MGNSVRLQLAIFVQICTIVVLFSGCGPEYTKEYSYIARAGDTPRALSLRLTESEMPVDAITIQTGLNPNDTFDEPTLIRLYEKDIKNGKGRVDLLEYYESARVFATEHNYAIAKIEYETMLVEIDDPSARAELAAVSLLSGDIDAYEELVTSIKPEHPSRFDSFQLAEICRKLGLYDEAWAKYFVLLLSDDSDSVAAFVRFAIKKAIRAELLGVAPPPN